MKKLTHIITVTIILGCLSYCGKETQLPKDTEKQEKTQLSLDTKEQIDDYLKIYQPFIESNNFDFTSTNIPGLEKKAELGLYYIQKQGVSNTICNKIREQYNLKALTMKDFVKMNMQFSYALTNLPKRDQTKWEYLDNRSRGSFGFNMQVNVEHWLEESKFDNLKFFEIFSESKKIDGFLGVIYHESGALKVKDFNYAFLETKQPLLLAALPTESSLKSATHLPHGGLVDDPVSFFYHDLIHAAQWSNSVTKETWRTLRPIFKNIIDNSKLSHYKKNETNFSIFYILHENPDHLLTGKDFDSPLGLGGSKKCQDFLDENDDIKPQTNLYHLRSTVWKNIAMNDYKLEGAPYNTPEKILVSDGLDKIVYAERNKSERNFHCSSYVEVSPDGESNSYTMRLAMQPNEGKYTEWPIYIEIGCDIEEVPNESFSRIKFRASNFNDTNITKGAEEITSEMRQFVDDLIKNHYPNRQLSSKNLKKLFYLDEEKITYYAGIKKPIPQDKPYLVYENIRVMLERFFTSQKELINNML
jgi:hypothetical protein